MDDFLGEAQAPAAPAADDMSSLIQAVLNEKNAPEILQFRQDLIERVETALRAQEEYCEQLEQDMEQELRRMMLSLEVKRVRYLLKSYYKTRLMKIEKFAATIADSEDVASRLSSAEAEFAKDYFIMVGRHLKDTVLGHFPDDFQQLVQLSKGLSEGNDLIPKPVMDTHVFCKLLDDVGSVPLDEGQSVDMHADDLFMLKYRAVADLVRNQQAVLI